MIKSRFSKAILPLAFTTAISGGMLVKTAVSEKSENKIEQNAKTTNPIENPAVLGTIFTLGLLGTAGAATLGKAVDLRYKSSHEQIEDIFDIASLKEKDYQEAFEEECAELDKQEIVYDKEELRKQKYTPMRKEDVLKYIDTRKAHLRRVTENVSCDKKAEQQLKYLIEEIKSGVKYDKEIDNDIKTRMLYQFDKATTPANKWSEKDIQYRTKYPDINFDKRNGIPLQSKMMGYIQTATAKLIADKYEIIEPERVLKNLNQIKEQITEQPEILNKYDREECLKLTNKAIQMLEKGEDFDYAIYNEIIHIFIYRQQTY